VIKYNTTIPPIVIKVSRNTINESAIPQTSFPLRRLALDSFSPEVRSTAAPIRVIGKLHRDLHLIPSLLGSP
jgi:hypothetical protein